MRLAVALCLVSLPRARCLLGTAAPPTEASPESVERVLQPAITFTLAAEPAAAEQAGAEDDWRRLARTVAQLQQLECTEDVLGAQVHMVDAAEQGDRLAMAALGSMFLLGQDCARKRNLTWGYHWLSRAVELEQPDALALMGFLHTTDVLRDLYNFTAVTHHVSHTVHPLLAGCRRPATGNLQLAWGALCSPPRHAPMEPEQPAWLPARALHTWRRLERADRVNCQLAGDARPDRGHSAAAARRGGRLALRQPRYGLQVRQLRGRPGTGWAGLGWAGLGWAGLGWAGLALGPATQGPGGLAQGHSLPLPPRHRRAAPPSSRSHIPRPIPAHHPRQVHGGRGRG